MYLVHIWKVNSMEKGESISAYQIQKEFADILVSIFDEESLPLFRSFICRLRFV